MSKEYILTQEYKRVMPISQPYARFNCTKESEKAWWHDYHRRNPTFFMKLLKIFNNNYKGMQS